MNAWWRPRFDPQLSDPTTKLGPYLCTMESAAMALDFQTLGGVRVEGGQLAAVCGKTPAQIEAHGTSLDDAAVAWAHWGVPFDNRTRQGWAALLAALAGGRCIMAQGIYGALPASLRVGSFIGPHCMILSPEPCGVGMILVGDPLHTGWVAMPDSAIAAYMVALAVHEGLGAGQLFWAATVPHVPAPTKYTAHFAPGGVVLVASLNAAGAITGWTRQTWGPNSSSAPCGAPFWKKNAVKGSALVVLVTAGVFAHKYINVAGGVTVTAS